MSPSFDQRFSRSQADDEATLRARLGRYVRAERERRNLTRAAFARFAGITAPTLARLEDGLGSPNGSTTSGVAAALGLRGGTLELLIAAQATPAPINAAAQRP